MAAAPPRGSSASRAARDESEPVSSPCMYGELSESARGGQPGNDRRERLQACVEALHPDVDVQAADELPVQLRPELLEHLQVARLGHDLLILCARKRMRACCGDRKPLPSSDVVYDGPQPDELFSCLVETNTPVCESAAEARDELVRLRAVVRDAAGREGLAVAAAGSHPFSRAEDQEIVDEPRYLKMLEELGRSCTGSSSAACTSTSAWRASSVPADARGDPALAAHRSRALAQLAVPRRAGRRARSRLGRHGCPSCRAAGSRRPSHRPRNGRLTSRRPGGLHAQLVGCAASSAARDARGADRRPADERRARRRAGCARPGALRGASDGAAHGRVLGGRAARRAARRRRAPADAGRAGCARARHLRARRQPARARRGSAAARGRGPRRPRGRRSRPRRAHRAHERSSVSALYPLRLVAARLGRRSAPVLLVVLGIAAGASVVFGGRAATLVAQDRAVAQAIERIPDGRARCGRSGSACRLERRAAARARAPRARARSPARSTRRQPRSSSSARPRSRARSPGSAASRASADWSRSAPAGCRGRARRSAARCCGSAAQGRLPQPDGAAARRGRARRRSTTASSSATSSRRPTTRSPTPR